MTYFQQNSVIPKKIKTTKVTLEQSGKCTFCTDSSVGGGTSACHPAQLSLLHRQHVRQGANHSSSAHRLGQHAGVEEAAGHPVGEVEIRILFCQGVAGGAYHTM